jgi:hypothetical protein
MSDHYETRCPSCGGSDEQGCYADCPTNLIPALTARVRELEGALQAWDDAVRIDVVMEGPRYMGVSSTLGRIAWEKTRAALTQPAEEKPND